MTKPKHVASSLKDILENPLVISILDKSNKITEIIQTVQNFWEFDLFSRRPGPAYIDGVFQGTNLDLAAFLYALIGRNAVINISSYKSFRQTKFKTGQHLVSKENRHGVILGVTANKYTFVFSVKIKDVNVMKSEEVGDYRNFSLTNFEGKWYDGWKKIEFLPTIEENKFITENRIWSEFGNVITFKNFIHPNRWTSFFGQYYFITKLLIDRLAEEAKHLFKETERMLEKGISFPPSDREKVQSFVDKDIDKGKSIKVEAFEVEIDVPENDSQFLTYKDTQENLVGLFRLANSYRYSIIPKLRFMTRATEFAHYTFPNRFPTWIENTKWERDYVLKGKRKKWQRLVLFQPGVGQQAVSIRKREYEKSEIVTETY